MRRSSGRARPSASRLRCRSSDGERRHRDWPGPRSASVAFVVVLLAAASALPAVARCSFRFLEEATFRSSNGDYTLHVDYGSWEDESEETVLTYRKGDVTLWTKRSSELEDYWSANHVHISDDGNWLVFGGVSAHNISFDLEHREGLRFYRRDGSLIRFVSRRDLPVVEYGISTAFWYDGERTGIVGSELRFYTPGLDEPLVFEVSTGELVRGRLIEGQGDDAKHGDWLREVIEGAQKPE